MMNFINMKTQEPLELPIVPDLDFDVEVYAKELEDAIMEMMNGKLKAGKLPVEPMVRLIAYARTGSVKDASAQMVGATGPLIKGHCFYPAPAHASREALRHQVARMNEHLHTQQVRINDLERLLGPMRVAPYTFSGAATIPHDAVFLREDGSTRDARDVFSDPYFIAKAKKGPLKAA